MWATLREMLLLHRQCSVLAAFGKRVNTQVVARLSSVHMENQRGSHSSTDSSGVTSYTWCPSNVIHPPHRLDNGHGCLVLNRRVCMPSEVAQQVWQNAYVRCLVDGGANRWRDFLQMHCQDKQMKPPELITGDFDSITEDTKQFFNGPLTKYVHTPDQNETDFTKAVGVVRPLLEQEQLHNIIVFHDSSGRFDHIMGNINTLFKVQSTTLHVYLLSGWSMAWLLRPGRHSIIIPSELVAQQRWCSLIPVGGSVRSVTTTGLKWNLTNSVMEFGGMVSTSNTYASEQVHIDTSDTLLWSMGLWQHKDDD